MHLPAYACTSLLAYAFATSLTCQLTRLRAYQHTSLRAYALTTFFKCLYAMEYQYFGIRTVNCLYSSGANGIELVYELTSLVPYALINSRACQLTSFFSYQFMVLYAYQLTYQVTVFFSNFVDFFQLSNSLAFAAVMCLLVYTLMCSQVCYVFVTNGISIFLNRES